MNCSILHDMALYEWLGNVKSDTIVLAHDVYAHCVGIPLHDQPSWSIIAVETAHERGC